MITRAAGLVVLATLVNAFNLDLRTAVEHKSIGSDSQSSWFGFDMDFYKHDGETWLLVGAPRDQSPQQRQIRKGGRVYRCSTSEQRCQSITSFEREGNARGLNGSVEIEVEDKSNQWLGSSISTSPDGTSVLACAPRYVYYYSRYLRQNQYAPEWGPTGYCYLAQNNFADVSQIAPGRTNQKWGYHREGYALWGYSAQFGKDSDTFFLGGPGSFYWQGSISVNSVRQLQGSESTGPRDKSADDSYMGYSMAVADFDGDGYDDVAVGVPRYSNTDDSDGADGMVAIYDRKLNGLKNLTGEQIGSYFGYSIAATDLDGDGKEDLIIGEPFFNLWEPKERYEVGRVNVFYQGSDSAFRTSVTIDGTKQWGQFGLAVTAAGDLNHDGFNDFIVGAPYDGEDSHGAIYVYHGSADGVIIEASQVINAKDVSPRISTFGFSFASGYDVDNNGYPDIAVGAYKSAHAIIFRTRPVIKLTMRLVNQDAEIDLDTKTCQRYDNSGQVMRSCATIRVCMVYDGENAPPIQRMLVHTELDVEQEVKRAMTVFGGSNIDTNTVSLSRGVEGCVNTSFDMKNDIRNKLSPLAYRSNVSIETPSDYTIHNLPPILDHFGDRSMTKHIPIRNNCEEESSCIPDLQLNVKAPNGGVLLLGSKEKMKLHVEVVNTKEDAHQARVAITVPPGVHVGNHQLSKMEDGSSSIEDSKSLTCVNRETDVIDELGLKGHIYECDIGNPLPRGEAIAFDVDFSAGGIKVAEKVPFTVNATSFIAEPESSLHDNFKVVNVEVKVDVKLKVWSRSVDEIVNFGEKDRRAILDKEGAVQFDEDIGPLVKHVYEIKSEAESQIRGLYVDIYWPSHLPAYPERHLLYLIDKPTADAPFCQRQRGGCVTCRAQQPARVNPLNLAVNREVFKEALTGNSRIRREIKDNVKTDAKVEEASKLAKWASNFRWFINMIFRGKAHNIGEQTTDAQHRLAQPLVDCTNMNCTQFHCEVDAVINKDDSILVTVYSRLWLNTLIDEVNYDARITSVMNVRAKKVEGAGAQDAITESVVSAATTLVSPTDRGWLSRSMPWWLYLLAILAGITLLILLILALWRVGFFKRNRPPRGQASLQHGAGASEHYGFADSNTGYAPASQYDQSKYGQRL